MAGKTSISFHDFSHKGATGWRAEKISKNSWMDLYADLYRQVFGEEAPAEDILADAENRLRILRENGLR